MDSSDQLNKCRNFLKNHDFGVIATSSPDGRSHASVVNYFMRDNLDIFFIARANAQKFKNIHSNPWTCLVVCDYSFTSSLEVKGNAEQLEDSPRVTELLMRFAKLLRQKNSGPLPILKHSGAELYLFRLQPQTLAYADFRPSQHHDGEYFEISL